MQSFVYLKDEPDMNKFDMEEEKTSPETPLPPVTAVIAGKTPFGINGQSVTLSCGLSPSASTNTIIGLPFLCAAQPAILMKGNDDESMICQKLGSTFCLEYIDLLHANQSHLLAPGTHTLPTPLQDSLRIFQPLSTSSAVSQMSSSF
jgi:hypothetical protein